MQQIFLAYGLLKETVTDGLQKLESSGFLPEGDINFFGIVAGVSQCDTLA